MAKHTGGEWEAIIDPDDEPGCDIEIQCQGAPIAKVMGFDNFPCFDADEHDPAAVHAEAVANARLIAAAPLLLAAIDKATGMNWDDMRQLNMAYGLLTDALAKAKGE